MILSRTSQVSFFRFLIIRCDGVSHAFPDVDPSKYVDLKDRQYGLFLEVKDRLDSMGKASDGLMKGTKDEIVSWWRGRLGETSVICYEDRNWGYAFYLMAALCVDNSDGTPITRGLIEQIEFSSDSTQLKSFWEELMVFCFLTFGLVLNTPVSFFLCNVTCSVPSACSVSRSPYRY